MKIAYLCQPIILEDVQWALHRVRKGADPRQDEVVADMMLADSLAEVWLNLFQLCWEFSIVPLVWKYSNTSTEEASERGV